MVADFMLDDTRCCAQLGFKVQYMGNAHLVPRQPYFGQLTRYWGVYFAYSCDSLIEKEGPRDDG